MPYQIRLRNKQTPEMKSDQDINDASVTIYAPWWMEQALKKISHDLAGKTFEVCDNNNHVIDTITLGKELTLKELLIIARNEKQNLSGVINANMYGDLDPRLIYALKDLVKFCIIVGKDKATHYGGYPKGSAIYEHKEVENVYLCDLIALQFQQSSSTGRLVLISNDPALPLPEGKLDDFIYRHVVGQPRPTVADCQKDRQRFILFTTDLPSFGGPKKQYYFDTEAYKAIVAQDFIMAVHSLNQSAQKTVNFKFLAYGTGAFAPDKFGPIVKAQILAGVKLGLEKLFNEYPKEKYAKIKRMEFPFYDLGARNTYENDICKLCKANGIECVFSDNDALKKTSQEHTTATTNNADPHVTTGNEMERTSVDANIALNLESSGNKFSPLLNTLMNSVHLSNAPKKMTAAEIKSTVISFIANSAGNKQRDNYLGWMSQNANGTRGVSRWSHWKHGKAGKVRAINLLTALNNDSTTTMDQVIQTVKTALEASANHKHSLSRYLIAAFGYDLQDLQDLSSKEFSIVKSEFITQLNDILSTPSSSSQEQGEFTKSSLTITFENRCTMEANWEPSINSSNLSPI